MFSNEIGRTGVCRLFLVAVLSTAIVACTKSDPAGPNPNEGSPAAVTAVSGDGQTAPAGAAVPVSPAVRVVDAAGTPVSGVSVTFSVTSGGGSVTGSPATTGSDGVATAGSWVLGATPGPNELSARVGSLPPVTFAATAVSGFDIELRYLTSATSAQRQAFDNASARWRSIVIGDLSDIMLDAQPGQCGSNSPTLSDTVDDLLILVSVEAIDGPGGVLGTAGPCFVRLPSNLPILGQMRFDTDDLNALESNGNLETVILHELGHVLGVGTLWLPEGLLADPSLSGGTDPHFTGLTAIAAFDTVGGASYTGAKVPVEDTGGPGTADGHWREAVLDDELLTGFLEPGRANPLSVVTVRSLEDQGYAVSVDAADSFSIPSSSAASPPDRAGPEVVMLNDIWRGPIYGVDNRGQVIRVVHP